MVCFGGTATAAWARTVGRQQWRRLARAPGTGLDGGSSRDTNKVHSRGGFGHGAAGNNTVAAASANAHDHDPFGGEISHDRSRFRLILQTLFNHIRTAPNLTHAR